MNQLKAESALVSIQPASSDPDTTLPPPSSGRRVPLHAGSSAQFTGEIQTLLRNRLRVSAAIASVGLFAFFLWNLVDGPRSVIQLETTDRVLHALVILVSGAASALLFSSVPISLRGLRILEGLIFGLIGLFLAWLQFGQMCDGGASKLAAAGAERDVVRLSHVATILRWFVLLVLYGTFIPNTWRRCAVVVGALALFPVSITVWFVVGCPVIGHLFWPYSVVDTALFMGIGAAIAIFGSHKLTALHKEAFEMRQLGQYRLKERLGFGGMGEVYLAEHRLLRRPCAIKLIRPDRAGDRNSLVRFEREVQETARLTHWNTVEIYDYGHTDDGTFYYVMEYLPGEDLQELVDRHGPLPPARVIHILRQVCGALNEAHQTGLIHRDIKPNNVILCERGGVRDVVKLLDFGLVSVSDLEGKDQKITRQGSIAGSPAYLSPEQAKGLDQVDARSDIYGLGAVAYYLLTGKPPFERETAIEIIAAHLRDTVMPLRTHRPDLPGDLQDVVMQCLEKNPQRRYQSVMELDEALAACHDAGRWSQEQANTWWGEHEAHGPAVNGEMTATI